MTGSLLLAFVAGGLSTLSPCVLPLLPVVLGTAVSEHRLGPVALAAGLALSFMAFGLFLATAGRAAGLDGDALRQSAAALLLVMGAVLFFPRASEAVAVAAGPLGHWFDNRFGGASTPGLKGQFALGLLLGAVWSPCVGPTLGAASVLAAQGRDLGQVALTMGVFGLGAALPLLLLGFVSREAMLRARTRLMQQSMRAKAFLGLLLMTVSIMILTGFDKRLEAFLVQHSPDWLIEVTTRL